MLLHPSFGRKRFEMPILVTLAERSLGGAPEGTTSADHCCVRFACCICCIAGSPLSSIRSRLHPRCTAQARSSAAALRLVPYRAISIYFSPGAAASSNPAAFGAKDADCLDVDWGSVMHLWLFVGNHVVGGYRQQARRE